MTKYCEIKYYYALKKIVIITDGKHIFKHRKTHFPHSGLIHSRNLLLPKDEYQLEEVTGCDQQHIIKSNPDFINDESKTKNNP